MYLCVYLCVSLCMCIYVCVSLYMCTYMCVFVYTHRAMQSPVLSASKVFPSLPPQRKPTPNEYLLSLSQQLPKGSVSVGSLPWVSLCVGGIHSAHDLHVTTHGRFGDVQPEMAHHLSTRHPLAV